MRIAIVGSGALGGFYGAKLARAGFDVHFLARSDYGVLRERGLRVESVDGDFHIQPSVYRHTDRIGPCDLVLVGLKTTDNAHYDELIRPLVRDDTAILTLQNGLGNEEQLAAIFGASHVVGGIAFLCSNRPAPGVVRHTEYGYVRMAEAAGGRLPRTQAIRDAFVRAGIDCEIVDDLPRMRWMKLVWNIPFNGLSVAGHLATVDRILAHPPMHALAVALMRETIAGAAALGLAIPDRFIDDMLQKTGTMGPYKPSMYLDYERGRPMEVEGIVGEPLRRAQSAGASCPRMATLYALLHFLDAGTTRRDAVAPDDSG